jgi:hypothetical protein
LANGPADPLADFELKLFANGSVGGLAKSIRTTYNSQRTADILGTISRTVSDEPVGEGFYRDIAKLSGIRIVLLDAV